MEQSQYKRALKHIAKNEIGKAKIIQKSLRNYPLHSYLQFHLLAAKGRNLTERDVTRFIGKHKHSWLAERMRKHWLNTRKLRHDYKGFIKFYDANKDNSNKETQCFLAKSYFETGQSQKAIELTRSLWLHGESQPELCDDGFDELKSRRLLSQSLIFQRLMLSYETNQWSMIRYLKSLIRSAPYKIKLANLNRVRKNPNQLVDILDNSTLDADYQAMILYIIKRLAHTDASKALNLWKKIAVKVMIDSSNHNQMLNTVCSRRHTIAFSEQCLKIAKLRKQFPVNAISSQIETALQFKDWNLTMQWINMLPETIQIEEKWQYWLARSYQYSGKLEQANAIFKNIANSPKYHGFLASIHINQPIQLQQKVRQLDNEVLKQVMQTPAVQRAIELNNIGHSLHSRQEWKYAMNTLNGEQLIAAAHIGMQAQWGYASISAMTTAKYWDELHLRFPINYFEYFEKNSKKYDMDTSWLLGLSRKESNFIADIQSYAGAIGVMQVLPTTAREMARKINLRYSKSKLKQPSSNIKLGSTYLNLANKTFNQNPAYSTAAYNAGISRIKTWLDESREKLPIDVWVDTIPNSGVQDYVRSVMQFSVFYADKLGTTSPLLAFGQSWFHQPEKAFN